MSHSFFRESTAFEPIRICVRGHKPGSTEGTGKQHRPIMANRTCQKTPGLLTSNFRNLVNMTGSCKHVQNHSVSKLTNLQFRG